MQETAASLSRAGRRRREGEKKNIKKGNRRERERSPRGIRIWRNAIEPRRKAPINREDGPFRLLLLLLFRLFYFIPSYLLLRQFREPLSLARSLDLLHPLADEMEGAGGDGKLIQIESSQRTSAAAEKKKRRKKKKKKKNGASSSSSGNFVREREIFLIIINMEKEEGIERRWREKKSKRAKERRHIEIDIYNHHPREIILKKDKRNGFFP